MMILIKANGVYKGRGGGGRGGGGRGEGGNSRARSRLLNHRIYHEY